MGTRRAFTLLELAVVVAILGTLMAVVLPRLDAGALGSGRLAAAAGRLVSVATFGRNLAITARTPLTLELDLSGGGYRVVNSEDAAAGAVAAEGVTLRGRLPEGVRFVDAAVSPGEPTTSGTVPVRLSPEGWADPAVVHLSGPDGEGMTVIVTALRVQVESHRGRLEGPPGGGSSHAEP